MSLADGCFRTDAWWGHVGTLRTLTDSNSEGGRMEVHVRCGLVFWLLLLCSCEASRPESDRGVARDSAGSRIIALPDESSADGRLQLSVDTSWMPAVQLETGHLLDLELVADRGILLLDELAEKITLVSNSGESLATIGREGEGPGEFNPQGLSQVIATDSSVLVPDLFLQRLTEFRLDGSVMGMRTFPLSPVYAVDWRKHPGGGLAFRAFEQFGDQIIRMDGEAVDTLLSLEISNDQGNLLLSPMTVWDLTDEGNVVITRTDWTSVELRRAGSGDLVWRAEWTRAPEELNESTLRHLDALVRDRILRDTPYISGDVLAQSLASIEYPAVAPVLAGLMVAENGDIWVRRARPVQEMGPEALAVGSPEGYGGPDWDVLDERGFLKARVRLPGSFAPRRFVGSWLYGILADELGIESPARVEIRF